MLLVAPQVLCDRSKQASHRAVSRRHAHPREGDVPQTCGAQGLTLPRGHLQAVRGSVKSSRDCLKLHVCIPWMQS